MIIPFSVPGLLDAMRVNIAATWNLVVVAELIAAEEGLGYRIVRAGRFRQTDTIFAVLIVIGADRRGDGHRLPGSCATGSAPVGPMTCSQAASRGDARTTPRQGAVVRALVDVDLHVEEGELVTLVGRQRLRQVDPAVAIAGPGRPTDGAVLVDGHARHRARARPGPGLPGLLALPLAHGGGERRRSDWSC